MGLHGAPCAYSFITIIVAHSYQNQKLDTLGPVQASMEAVTEEDPPVKATRYVPHDGAHPLRPLVCCFPAF